MACQVRFVLTIHVSNIDNYSTGDKPKDVLGSAVSRMKAAKHHPNAVGVQFVQIGGEPDAAEALKELMFGGVGVSTF
jgi:hypothetical protein